jgi:hypothetical protein
MKNKNNDTLILVFCAFLTWVLIAIILATVYLKSPTHGECVRIAGRIHIAGSCP